MQLDRSDHVLRIRPRDSPTGEKLHFLLGQFGVDAELSGGGGKDRRLNSIARACFEGTSALVKFLAIELPSSPMSPAQTREALELPGDFSRRRVPRELLQILGHKLIHSCAHRLRLPARTIDHLVGDGESDVHKHRIRVHVNRKRAHGPADP